jgi:hypothetical protein
MQERQRCILFYTISIFFTLLGAIAHNVPAVYDVFAATMKKLRSGFCGRKNVGGGWRGNERSD